MTPADVSEARKSGVLFILSATSLFALYRYESPNLLYIEDVLGIPSIAILLFFYFRAAFYFFRAKGYDGSNGAGECVTPLGWWYLIRWPDKNNHVSAKSLPLNSCDRLSIVLAIGWATVFIVWAIYRIHQIDIAFSWSVFQEPMVDRIGGWSNTYDGVWLAECYIHNTMPVCNPEMPRLIYWLLAPITYCAFLEIVIRHAIAWVRSGAK